MSLPGDKAVRMREVLREVGKYNRPSLAEVLDACRVCSIGLTKGHLSEVITFEARRAKMLVTYPGEGVLRISSDGDD